MPNCIPRFCYHQFSELPPTTEANLKTYSRQKVMTACAGKHEDLSVYHLLGPQAFFLKIAVVVTVELVHVG
jgi:hypothetical protein